MLNAAFLSGWLLRVSWALNGGHATDKLLLPSVSQVGAGSCMTPPVTNKPAHPALLLQVDNAKTEQVTDRFR